MKRVLLTGATGFIGRWAPAALAARNFEVHAVSRCPPRQKVPGVARWHTADLIEAGAPTAVVKSAAPSHLLHLAWCAEHGAFWTSEENLRWVGASLELMRAFVHAGGHRATIAGTCAEYDWRHGWCVEDVTPLAPNTLYGASKDSFRRVVEAYTKGDRLSMAWGRIFLLYGPNEAPRRLVASITCSLLRGEIAATSSGMQWRDMMHVEDAVAAMVALLDCNVEGAVNIASGQPVPLRKVIDRLAELTGRPDLLEVGAYPNRKGEPLMLAGDPRRLRVEVGFTPRYDLDGGLRNTVEWWRGRLTNESNR